MEVLNVTTRVFVKTGEDYEKIKKTFLELIDLDLEKQKIELEEQTVRGFQDEKIKIIKVFLEKKRHVKAFVEHLIGKIDREQKELLLRQKESRLDDELNFFIRLDKTKLLDGEYRITDSGDCFHIRMLVASYPKKKETALKVIEELLG